MMKSSTPLPRATASAADGIELTLRLRDALPVTLLLEDHVFCLPSIKGLGFAVHTMSQALEVPELKAGLAQILAAVSRSTPFAWATAQSTPSRRRADRSMRC